MTDPLTAELTLDNMRDYVTAEMADAVAARFVDCESGGKIHLTTLTGNRKTFCRREWFGWVA